LLCVWNKTPIFAKKVSMNTTSIDYNDTTFPWSLLDNLSDKMKIAIINRLSDALLHPKYSAKAAETDDSGIVGLWSDALPDDFDLMKLRKANHKIVEL